MAADNVIRLNQSRHFAFNTRQLGILAAELFDIASQRLGLPEAELARALSAVSGIEVPKLALSAWRKDKAVPPPQVSLAAMYLAAIDPADLPLLLPLHAVSPVGSSGSDASSHAETIDATVELARRAMSTGTNPEMLTSIEDSVNRLCREYSGTPPGVLVPRVHVRLRQIDELRQHTTGLSDLHRLHVAAGWLHLLLAALHFDLDQRELADASRGAALFLARETSNPEIEAWAHETASWWANFEGRFRDGLDHAAEGARIAPPNSSARMMTLMKQVMAYGRLQDREGAERVLDQARRELAHMPKPKQVDHHFVFDPPKLDFYASTAYSWLGEPNQAEQHARKVIEQAGGRNDPTWVPTRVAIARFDLGTALATQGNLDGATEEAGAAFESFVRHDTLIRAREFVAEVEARWPNSREVQDLKEQVRTARKTLALAITGQEEDS